MTFLMFYAWKENRLKYLQQVKMNVVKFVISVIKYPTLEELESMQPIKEVDIDKALLEENDY